MTRDSQRSRLYAWEQASIPSGRTMSLEECQEMVTWALAQYGITGTVVGDGRRRRAAGYSWWTDTVKLPRWARTEKVVAHEIAHAVIRKKQPGEVAPHGAEFARVMIDIWDRRGLISRKDAIASARLARVKVASRRPHPEMIGARAVSRLEKLRERAQALQAELHQVNVEIAALRRGETTKTVNAS